ncbi:MAG: hypothetical protein Q9161_009455, partial [Pseudevernia consocians]
DPNAARQGDSPDISGSDTGEPKISGKEIIARRGLDAYLFLRYLMMLLKIFIPLATVIVPVLIPVNLTGGRGAQGGVSGLDQLSWTNVSPTHTDRYWVHLVLAILVVVWVCRIARTELLCYTRLRHRWLISSDRLGRTSTTTILVTDIPRSLLDVHQLHTLYSIYPHGVRRVSLNRDHSKLRQCIRKRDQIALLLEHAETKLIQKAYLSRARRVAKRLTSEAPDTLGRIAGSFWKQYLNAEDREKVRLPTQWGVWMPSILWAGKSVDKIDHYRTELELLNAEISQYQAQSESQAASTSALIQFNHPIGAHMACQALQHLRPHTMIASQVEESSESLIWEYISMRWWERYLRAIVVSGVIGALIVLCTVPVAFTGLLSQVSYLTTVFPRLSWLKELPASTIALLQGVLPAGVLAAVMILLPLILYRLLLQQGTHSRIAVELSMQEYYFYFLFIQLFLVVSVSSSLAALLNGFTQDFTSVAGMMAQNLPKAGNYFFSYMILQAMSVSAATLLQLGRLIFFLVGFLLDTTARQKWERRLEPEIRWGTFFPVYTNLAVIGRSSPGIRSYPRSHCIGLIYSVVSPLILILNIITFSLFLAVQRYNILKLARFDVDTGGLVYPKAINQLFVGLYVMECYLIGLFFLVRNEHDQVACIGQGIIMIIVTFLTAAYQVLLNQALQPLFKHLPVVLIKTEQPAHGESKASPKTWQNFFKRIINELDDVVDGVTEEGTIIEGSLDSGDMDAKADAQVEDSTSVIIQDQGLMAEPPIIWLPQDTLELSKDAIEHTKTVYTSIVMSDENAELGEKAAVHAYGDPPAFTK